jgi:hypothetical protein
VRGAAVLLVGLLSGCALAPGMRLDERAATDHARAKDGKFTIQPITAGVIAALAEERWREEPRSPDPVRHATPGPYTGSAVLFDIARREGT